MLNSAVLVSIRLPVSWQVQVHLRNKKMPNSVDHLVMTEISFLEQVDFQKRFLKYPSSSVYGATVQNRG